MAVSFWASLMVYCQITLHVSHVPQLEHLVSFLSKHADGILKDQVDKLQNKLVELRSLLFFAFSLHVPTPR